MHPDCFAASADPADPAVAFLRSTFPPHLATLDNPDHSAETPARPFVTLTYAQSLDGKIAGAGGAQIRLSGDESMTLTHRLRQLHDSILVGVGTVLNDDPQLTVRLPELRPLEEQPAPFILDSNLRTPPTAKLILNAQKGISRPVTILTSLEHAAKTVPEGAAITAVRRDATGHLDLQSLFSPTSDASIRPSFGRSLMVEGGASVITSFLASGLVDLVLVTVAPVLVGAEGVSVTQLGVKMPRLEHVKTQVFGKDTVFVCRPVYDNHPASASASSSNACSLN
ncbi:2,5-diamino-6-(ribosylamino)-4(3H)-pyrimidinone 5'-phosphate reductase [Rhodotorula paludigena]|uniref:2,5-diamino-6-(ribosylamino)-4(3H)-pyrimidinone 5'-phosphate reductase n=1 Tax=Rhodotorula paludigena TaxID=86838 RepID=UPI00316B42C9